MSHYYIYTQSWSSSIRANSYNAYTDNEFMMIEYIKQIGHILEQNQYIGGDLSKSVIEVDFKSESELLYSLNCTEAGFLFTRENKICLYHSDLNNHTVFLNQAIYSRFCEELTNYNEILKLRADYYRMSSPTLVETVIKYISKPYLPTILDMYKVIHEQYVSLTDLVNDNNGYYIKINDELWEIVDVVPTLLRFINIDIMKLFRLEMLPFY